MKAKFFCWCCALQELKGNEKYAYLSQSFPTQEQAV